MPQASDNKKNAVQTGRSLLIYFFGETIKPLPTGSGLTPGSLGRLTNCEFGVFIKEVHLIDINYEVNVVANAGGHARINDGNKAVIA